MTKVFFFFLLLFSFNTRAQVVLDTIDTERGRMILYANRTWAYVKDKEFDGTLRIYVNDLEHLDFLVQKLKNIKGVQSVTRSDS